MNVIQAPRVALVTCAAKPDLDPESRHLADRLSACGVAAFATVWDDPQVDWNEFGLTVVRCGDDLVDRPSAFLRWASGVRHLANPADALIWSVGHVRSGQVRGRRRVALVFIAGAFSHAIRVPVQTSGIDDPVDDQRCDATAWGLAELTLVTGAELSLAQRVLGRAPREPRPLLYARVDVATDERDRPVLLALDLVCPRLFLTSVEGAADRLASAIKHRVAGDGSGRR